jgi:hypothetical protein
MKLSLIASVALVSFVSSTLFGCAAQSGSDDSTEAAPVDAAPAIVAPAIDAGTPDLDRSKLYTVSVGAETFFQDTGHKQATAFCNDVNDILLSGDCHFSETLTSTNGYFETSVSPSQPLAYTCVGEFAGPYYGQLVAFANCYSVE